MARFVRDLKMKVGHYTLIFIAFVAGYLAWYIYPGNGKSLPGYGSGS